MPRVSVVIPAHDASAFIDRTLSSVQAQTFEDWEVIAVDDASADDTAERLRAAAERDGRIRVIPTSTNLGPAGARNLGVEHAEGELVALLDADDAWLPEYLERQLALYDDHRSRGVDVGVVGCDAYLVSDGRTLAHTWASALPSHDPPTLDRLLAGNFIFISAMVPRDVGDEVGWFAPELFGTEDHDLWIRILESGRAAVVNPEPLVRYEVAAGSVSANLARMAASYQRTLHRALGRGRLTDAQRRVALRELRYHRAMEVIAALRWDAALSRPAKLRRGIAETPTLVAVVLGSPHRWGQWARALRHGRSF